MTYGERVSRVETAAKVLRTAGVVDHRSDLGEGSADAVAGAGAVLDQQKRTIGSLGQDSVQRLSDPRPHLVKAPAPAGAGVKRNRLRLQFLGDSEIPGEHVNGSPVNRLVVGGQIQEVDRVKKQ